MQNKDAIIEKLIKENFFIREENAMLKEKIQTLEEKIAQLEKNSSNSSRPPSSDIVKPVKVVRKSVRRRKRGGQHGHRKFSRQPFEPEQVDEVIEYELKDKDTVGLKPLDEWFIIQQLVLPEKMYKVIEHRARKYLDTVTGKKYMAEIPDSRISQIRFWSRFLMSFSGYRPSINHINTLLSINLLLPN